ncbi:helix-turn-helix domain-containing protein [Alicyclobacillus tolerans]|uniref:helix-turn-helix domain-containing protein n=1 Tax=Alicyclobacillus tolerans TaxID=90970 RepID=UPI001F1CA9BD|nr:helix-turn-helix domain-containing protein [Alicyclobacillus tolerans]MCF8567024.1 helix-turn-helix domain-containing protein [Alicyclobacillus tolerans]
MKKFDGEDLIEIPYDEIRKVSLERIGDYEHFLEAGHGGHLQIHNYMLLFWRPILKSLPFNIWVSLAMRAFGQKEESWPSRNTIAEECGVTPETVDTHFKTLEKYFFAWKIIVKKPDGQNEPNIYKIRKNIPLLSPHLYKKLSPTRRRDHDKYIRMIQESAEVIIYDYDDLRDRTNAKRYLRYQPPYEE